VVTPFSRIALIGFGEVGQRLGVDFREDFQKSEPLEVAVYDILFSDPNSSPRRAVREFFGHATTSTAQAASDAELVICAVTAASDLDAARSVVPGLKRGAFYLDLNSVSPAIKTACADIIEAAGGRYVEAAVMTPIGPKGIASTMLLGGPHTEEFVERARALGFTGAKPFSAVIGQASATKMCRSVMIKGVEALLCESMLAARYYGVDKTVLDSLSDLLPVGDWEKLARYFVSRTLEHGTRRAEEMRESAKTVAEAGITPLMALATAEREDWSAAHKNALAYANDLGAMLDAIRQNIENERAASKAAE
jgi:3-hydroxyisobutyrate dehydrogenase-like beta-hydroxyacid dehydrogenase